MDSFIENSIIVNGSDEFSSFEIEESIIGDQGLRNESSTPSNHKTQFNKENVSIAERCYRSQPKDSSDSSESESEADAIVLSSDDEATSQNEVDATRNKTVETSAALDSSSSSSVDESTYVEVTQGVYNVHVAKIKDITNRINQYEKLLKLSSQLPDKGQKLKQFVVNLSSDLAEQQTILKKLRVKETRQITIDFQNLSINESQNKSSTLAELSYDDNDTIANLFQEIKNSEKSMPKAKDFADQPRLIKGQLMPHQRHALAWMIWREDQYPKGGILGDDMGLGKTLTTISLIARHFETKRLAENDKEDKAASRGGTLVVCPASVIRQWEDEINKFTNFSLSVCVHHGDKRSDNVNDLCSHDVVITTYGIVRTEVEKNYVLNRIKWDRIVLDEAHTIRNYTSKQSLTCCRLQAKRKWALTGTPIQNKHADVFALIKFLDCNPLNDFTTWKNWTKNKAEQKISYILKFLLLRRTKAELGKIGEISSLPEKTLEIVPVRLTADELKVYETVSSFSKILSEQFRQQQNADDSGRSSQNTPSKDLQKALDFFTISGSIATSHILLVILRLRQICIHPNLIDAMLMAEDIRDISGQEGLLDEMNEMTINRTNVDQKLLRTNPVFDAQRPSSKFESILHIMQTKVIDRGEKAVVVSQFTSVLQLFQEHLNGHDIKFLVLTGSTKVSHRQTIVQSFNEDADEQVLLLSLTAGGVGLNLCGANNLFFIDPHWNPQLESQAEDRVYRIGQTRPVTIYRFICEGTIEERIQKLQDRKKSVAKNILSGYKLNINDMMALI
ncbi:transcription termination factor 2-like isoform X1 [Bradysia coprophila]|uniref:transcription termination factor 2-like isoform X1 n=1 Tax=Bradysia coprophila TaxID=38358 RepID=UPI00187DA424|nr:transcription termination factor 2-like isoform X1 [Bradysia coprophila]